MLSAFTARPIVELKQKNIKITAILAHSDQLLVGLNTGVLRVYRVAPTDPGPSNESEDDNEDEQDSSNPHKSASLLREYEKFSRSPIIQLAIFREANILISLSSGIVSFYDLGSFELTETLSRTKGAACFAAASNVINDESSGGVNVIVSRLAVAVKRRLLVWEWQDGEMVAHDSSEDTTPAEGPEEITLVSGIKSLTWADGRKLVAGLQGQYYLIDIETKDIRAIVGPGAIGGMETSKAAGYGAGSLSYIGMGSMVPNPLATELGEREMLLARDINSLFIDKEGEPLQRRQVPWKYAPEAVGYSYPYMLALQEVSRGLLEVRNPSTLTLLQSVSLPEARILQTPNRGVSLAHQGKGFLVASERVVWRMTSLGYDAQVDELVEHGYLDEAISLLEMVEDTLVKDSAGRLREIKMIKAGMLFREKKFRDALDLFSEVEATPERVIALYPEIIAGDSAQPEEPQEQPPPSPAKSFIRDHKKTNSSISATSMKGSPSKTSSKKDTSAETASLKAASILSSKAEALSEKELKTAVRELQAFLADVRRRLQRFFDADQNVKDTPDIQTAENHQTLSHFLDIADVHGVDLTDELLDLAKLVDTTLFRVYMYATPSLAGSLFRIANFCDPGVVMEKLEETSRYSELVDFLYGKKLHRQALERLQKFGQADSTESIDSSLHGPSRTVAYLQNLPPELVDLVLEFAMWPLEAEPGLGMEVFLADTENAEGLPRMKVFTYLEGIDHALALRFLEHVIDELNDQSADLHQKLLDLYLERLKESPDEDVQTRFLTLLKASTLYSPSKILQALPTDNPTFYEARALVLSKMGNHAQALEIYVFKLHDPRKAEEYCNTVHVEEKLNASKRSSSRERRKAAAQVRTTDPLDEKPSMYGVLLNLYLNPPKGEEKRWGPAIEILARHGARLPASATLEMIPKDLLVKELEFYFRGRIRNAETITRESQVVSGLRKVEAVRAQVGLQLGEKGRRRGVRVDDERVCPVCHKRLGGSVISVFPDNSVVHLGCQARRQNELVARG